MYYTIWIRPIRIEVGNDDEDVYMLIDNPIQKAQPSTDVDTQELLEEVTQIL